MSDVVVVYPKRRNIELVMLIFAMALGFGGYLLTELNLFGQIPSNAWVVGLLWFGLGIGAHIAVRIRLPYADPLLLPIVMLLNGIGLAMIHRIDKVPLPENPASTGATSQLILTAIAIVGFVLVVTFLRDYRPLQGYTYVLFLVGVVLLLMPLMPLIGVEEYGARIWIRIAGISFQPAEVAKIVLVIAFASYLVEKKEVLALAGKRILGIDLPRPRDLGPIAIMWAVAMVIIIFERDLGTALLFFGLFVAMLYIATARPGWPILGLLSLGVGAIGAWLAFSHVQIRVNAWLDPFSNFDQNRQIINGQFGFAWGGILGTGWGLGRPGLTTFAKSDMIAAAIGEELGTAGLMAIIMLYGILVARGLRIALGAKEPFGKLMAGGLSFVFALQVFAIIGGVTRLLPLTGLTTPFMSQGGSSLIANWLIIGLLLVLSHQVRKPVATVGSGPGADLSGMTTELIRRPV